MALVDAVEVISSTPKKPHDGSTLINIVLDETGSMGGIKHSTISSYNEFIQNQKNTPGECNVSLLTFSEQSSYGARTHISGSNVRDQYLDRPLQDVQPLTHANYNPNGMTNLYDAIGHTIKSIEAKLKDKSTVPNVLVVIITDGDENSSREFKLTDIRAMIKEKEALGWTFVYLGANQDAWQVGQSFGLSKGQTMTYSVAEMGATMQSLSAATSVYRSTRSANSASVEANFFAPKDGE